MTIGNAFDTSVDYYDQWIKIALPDYETIFTIARDLIPFESDESIAVLDLGAGTGLFSQHVLDKYPQARFILIDVAEEMLAVAQQRFQAEFDRFTFVVDDYRGIDYREEFDLVVSSLSIHHLTDDNKKDLFQRINASLRKGGVFINVDQVKGPTDNLQEIYWSDWLAKVRARRADEDQIRDSIARRKAYDQDALLVDQLQWLEDAGFEDVDCVYKNYFVAVFYGRRS